MRSKLVTLDGSFTNQLAKTLAVYGYTLAKLCGCHGGRGTANAVYASFFQGGYLWEQR